MSNKQERAEFCVAVDESGAVKVSRPYVGSQQLIEMEAEFPDHRIMLVREVWNRDMHPRSSNQLIGALSDALKGQKGVESLAMFGVQEVVSKDRYVCPFALRKTQSLVSKAKWAEAYRLT